MVRERIYKILTSLTHEHENSQSSSPIEPQYILSSFINMQHYLQNLQLLFFIIRNIYWTISSGLRADYLSTLLTSIIDNVIDSVRVVCNVYE